MRTIKAALVGAGDRGARVYGEYGLKYPEDIEFVAVAEKDDIRREQFKAAHNLSEHMCFPTWEDMLERQKFADAVIICTQDRMHFEPALKAMEKGYHVMLEKPMAVSPEECIAIGKRAQKAGKVLLICHVLRYNGFFLTIRKLLDEGRIGRLVSIQHNENVGFFHQAHSYVRGNWRNSSESSPMILAKSCHDMDIMLWLAGADCRNISSFGSLTYFREENAPKGAPRRCMDGCPAKETCAYYAPGIYLTQNTGWPTCTISNDMSMEGRTKALKEGPYGKCVFRCDNDVVDHQVVIAEFENEVTAAFTMSAFTGEISRTIKLMGTKGEIRGHMEKNEIEITNFQFQLREVIRPNVSNWGHGGGDFGIMKHFVNLLQQPDDKIVRELADISIQSHIMAFAAEKARVEKKVLDLKEYWEKLKRN